MDTNQKIILITGGSEGLGFELAKKLAAKNKVIICARNIEKLEKVIRKIPVEAIQCDVANIEACKYLVREVLNKYEKIDVLVNNAGIIYEGEIDEYTEDQITKLLDINIKGVEILTHLVVPHMKKEKRGLILNIISQSGLYHRQNRSLYNSSKWAITGFTKCLQVDLAKYGIRVTGFYPGKMQTGLFESGNVSTSLDDGLSPEKAAKILDFVISADEDVLIPEIGAKALNQTSTETICY